MNVAPQAHRLGKWSIVALAGAGVVILVLVAAVVYLNSNAFRRGLIDRVAARTGRHIQVDGPLEVDFLSSTPSVRAERVTIGNPPWMPPGTTAEIGKLALEFDFPLPFRSSSIRKLEMSGATLHLVRDEASHTNWQLSAPGQDRGGRGHLIRSLSMPNAHLDLDDARRHIQFSGIVSAQDARAASGAPILRIEGAGRLNGKPATFGINGDPLASASHERPYRFAFAERSVDARLTGRASFPKPFSLDELDATYEIRGASLNDIFFLVGMHFPNTAPFTLTGKLARRGPRSTFSDLQSTFGESDLAGNVVTEMVNERSHVNADVHAKQFRLADLGRHDPEGKPIRAQPAKPLLLPDVQLPLNVLNRRDAVIRFSADTLVMRAMSFHAFDATGTIDHGVLKIPSLSAAVRDAHLTGSVTVDASQETPTTDADLRLAGLQLGQFFHKDRAQPPLEGLMHARLQIKGRGNSVHQVAATANGTLSTVLPHGSMRASLAEITGLNFRGLGLMLTAKDEATGVRCGVASFQARDGTLTAQHLLLDTDPVLITGTGGIELEDETVDLRLVGAPKKVRIGRMRSPVYVRGTVAHPSFGIDKGHVAAQAGEAVALGIALTPIAAVLALVDPGLTKDADCVALLEQANAR